MDYLLYLMFRCDGDVMESLDFGEVFWASSLDPRKGGRKSHIGHCSTFRLFVVNIVLP